MNVTADDNVLLEEYLGARARLCDWYERWVIYQRVGIGEAVVMQAEGELIAASNAFALVRDRFRARWPG